MNVALWIIEAVLAAVFVAAGAMKLSQPKAKLATSGLAWTEDFSEGAVKGIGALEVLAAIGLIVPPLVGVAPVLAPLAALGLVVVMLGGAVVHLRRGEQQMIAINAVLLVLALVVAWGRFGPYSF